MLHYNAVKVYVEVNSGHRYSDGGNSLDFVLQVATFSKYLFLIISLLIWSLTLLIVNKYKEILTGKNEKEEKKIILLLLFSSKSTQSRSCYIKLITLETQCCL